jgi:hypothetical protein
MMIVAATSYLLLLLLEAILYVNEATTISHSMRRPTTYVRTYIYTLYLVSFCSSDTCFKASIHPWMLMYVYVLVVCQATGQQKGVLYYIYLRLLVIK